MTATHEILETATESQLQGARRVLWDLTVKFGRDQDYAASAEAFRLAELVSDALAERFGASAACY